MRLGGGLLVAPVRVPAAECGRERLSPLRDAVRRRASAWAPLKAVSGTPSRSAWISAKMNAMLTCCRERELTDRSE